MAVEVGQHRSAGPAVDSTSTGGVPDDWRYESYEGVQVRVPSDWGWGGAPMGSGDQLSLCGDQRAAVVPNIDGLRLTDHSPFVGRPVMMSDACQVRRRRPEPGRQAPAVWFGSPMPVGTDTSGDQVAQTLAVGLAARDRLRD